MIQFLLSLRPTAKMFFDEGDAKSYTQEELDAIVQEKTKASFEAGKTKAGAEATAESERIELEEFRKNKVNAEATQTLTGITEALKAEDVSGATTLNPTGISRFVAENKEALNGLSGKELVAKVNSLKDVKGNELFFQTGEVNASNSLLGADKGGKEAKKVEYYPGTSIPKR